MGTSEAGPVRGRLLRSATAIHAGDEGTGYLLALAVAQQAIATRRTGIRMALSAHGRAGPTRGVRRFASCGGGPRHPPLD